MADKNRSNEASGTGVFAGSFKMDPKTAELFAAAKGADKGGVIDPPKDVKAEKRAVKKAKSTGKVTLLVLLPRIPLLRAVIGYISVKLFFGSDVTLVPVFCRVVPNAQQIEKLKTKHATKLDPVWVGLGEAEKMRTFHTTDAVKSLGNAKRLSSAGWDSLYKMSALEAETGTYSSGKLRGAIGHFLLYAYFHDYNDAGILQVFLKAVAVMETHLYATKKRISAIPDSCSKIKEAFDYDVLTAPEGTLAYAFKRMIEAGKGEAEIQELVGFWLGMRKKINAKYQADKQDRSRFDLEFHAVTDKLPIVVLRKVDYFTHRRFSGSFFLNRGQNCQLAIEQLTNGSFIILTSAAFRHDLRPLLAALNGEAGKEADHGKWRMHRIGRGHFLVTNGGWYSPVAETRRSMEQVVGAVMEHVAFLGSRPQRRPRREREEGEKHASAKKQ